MLLWLTFAAAVVAIVAGTVVAVVRAVRLWRAVRQVGSRFGPELEHISTSAAEIQGHLDEAEAAAARLREANDRLRTSRARLEVQIQAVREAQTVLRRLGGVLPGG